MIGGIIVTHASFALGIKDAVEMIVGKQKDFDAISLKEGESLQDLIQKIKTKKETFNCEKVYLFVDLFGATPSNASCYLCTDGNYEVIAGVNLPILLEFIMKRQYCEEEEVRLGIEKVSKEDFKWITKEDLL